MELVKETFYDKTPIYETLEDGTTTETIVNGAVVIGTSTKYVLTENEMQIQELKANLQATDYQAIKFAEGLITLEEYEPIKAQRQEWREQINSLEEQL